MRKSLVLACFLLLLTAASAYFARLFVSEVFRLRARRAFMLNDHLSAWRLYDEALAWGAERVSLDVDRAELILFGLDQSEAGVTIDLPLPAETSLPAASAFVSGCLRQTPYSARCWSLASDISMHEARRRRQATVLDLTGLSEDPLQNLLPEERMAVAELEIASRMEPMNAIYHDLLVDMYLGVGAGQDAAQACRRAVRALPRLDEHRYLLQANLPADMLEAAIAGFDDAAKRTSLVPHPEILVDAGRLLAYWGHDARAEPYFLKILDDNPDQYDTLMEVAMIRLRRKDDEAALEALQRAARVHPEDPWPDYYAGVAHMDLGRADLAVDDFRSSRAKGTGEVKIFHALGAALEARGQVQEAERQYAAAANLNPDTAEAWSALLDFSLRHSNRRGAVEACARLSRLNKGDAGANNACASLEADLQ